MAFAWRTLVLCPHAVWMTPLHVEKRTAAVAAVCPLPEEVLQGDTVSLLLHRARRKLGRSCLPQAVPVCAGDGESC